MKAILVFVNGELYQQINYKTKKIAKGNYSIFKKHGMIDILTGEKLENATFELLC